MCDRYRDGKCISRYCYYLSAGGTCLNPKMKPKPTNADRIRSMSDEELAEVSVYSTTRPDFDEGFDGEWYECGNIETWHSVFTADLYDSPDDAISYVLEWLQRKEEV